MQIGQNNASSSAAIWSAAMANNVNKAKAKVKKSEMIYNEEFMTPLPLIIDPFWQEIFINCARNKFPRGFVYSNRILKHRTSSNSIELPDEPADFAQTAIYFFQENGKLHSKLDQEFMKKRYENEIIAKITQDSTDWSKVARSKNRRSEHIREYVDNTYSHLSKAIRDELFTQINIGFGSKLLTKDDVTYIDGFITKIEGIDADENGILVLRKTPVQKPKAPKKENPDNFLGECHKDWYKFLDEFHKYIKESEKSVKTVVHTESPFT